MLEKADLSSAFLFFANFGHIVLKDVKNYCVHLKNAQYLTQEQINDAVGCIGPKLLKHLKMPEEWNFSDCYITLCIVKKKHILDVLDICSNNGFILILL